MVTQSDETEDSSNPFFIDSESVHILIVQQSSNEEKKFEIQDLIQYALDNCKCF